MTTSHKKTEKKSGKKELIETPLKNWENRGGLITRVTQTKFKGSEDMNRHILFFDDDE